MIGFNNNAGSAGGDSSYSSGPTFPGSSGDAPRPHRRGRVQSADFGMPERSGLLDLASTYLEVQARFSINAVPALAVLERGGPTDRDGVPVPVWDSIHSSPGGKPATTARPAEAVVPLIYDRRAAARKPRKTKRNS